MNVDPNLTKYMIKVKITADGVVEKPDVVGAIFGQTEGLLGDELDLRDLQKGGKIGRIEVEIDSKKGRTEGSVLIPSGLDQVETSILAASLETIDRIGPCKAKVDVESVEDVRIQRRQKIVEREGGYDTYRYTYLVKVVDFDRGNVIYMNDHEYIVSSISQSAIKLISVESGMHLQVTRSEFIHSRIRLSEMKAEISDYMVISANEKEAMLMDPAGKQITMQISAAGMESVNLLKYKEKYYYTE